MRKFILLFLAAVLMFNMTSCFDSAEIDDMLHVIAFGVDKGVSDKWRLTLLFSTMKDAGGGGGGGGGGSGGGGDEYTHVTIDAPSFFTGVDMLNTTLPRKISFTHAEFMVFSEDLAKSGLIGEYIAPIKRFVEIRNSAHVFVSKGKAEDFLKEIKPFVGSTISKSFEIFIQESENTGFFPHVTLQDFYSGLKSPYYQPIAILAAINDFKAFQKDGESQTQTPKFNSGGNYVAGGLPRMGENKIELFGSAVFNGDAMVETLSGDETRYMLMARDKFERGFFTIQDPTSPELIIPLDITTAGEPKITISTAGENPSIHIKIPLNADILAVQSRVDYGKGGLKKLLEKTVEQIIRVGVEDVIQKCQNLDADVFMFGAHAARNFLTIDELESYNWNERFKDAKVSVEAEVIIRRTGTHIKSNPIKGSKAG